MRGRGFAMPVRRAGCAPARDVRASVWLTLPMRACRIHLRAVLMLPGWCGGIAYGVCNAAGFLDYLYFPCLPYPARNIATYHVNLILPHPVE